MTTYLKLLVIRHAQSLGNQQGWMQGRGDDELSQTGRQQATQLAKQLQLEGEIPSQVYSSPLRRARETTTLLLAPWLSYLQPTVIYADELLEFQNGIFDGLTWERAKALYPDLCITLETSLDWIPIPGAESLQDGRDRAHSFLQRIFQRHCNGDRLWIISHSWILQQLIAELLGCDRTWGISIPNTSLFEFWLDHRRWHLTDQNRFNTTLWQIRRFNDTRHLDQ